MILDLAIIYSRCVQEGDCLLWEQALNGYSGLPYVWDGERTVNARRLTFEHFTGRKPRPGCIVAMKCRNKHCLYGPHMQETTRGALNKQLGALGIYSSPAARAARTAGARKAAKCKLTMAIAREIRAADGSYADKAARFGISKRMVGGIMTQEFWREQMVGASVFNQRAA
jgi:hypothetical protein